MSSEAIFNETTNQQRRQYASVIERYSNQPSPKEATSSIQWRKPPSAFGLPDRYGCP
jgi:hypothetical protein